MLIEQEKKCYVSFSFILLLWSLLSIFIVFHTSFIIYNKMVSESNGFQVVLRPQLGLI